MSDKELADIQKRIMVKAQAALESVNDHENDSSVVSVESIVGLVTAACVAFKLAEDMDLFPDEFKGKEGFIQIINSQWDKSAATAIDGEPPDGKAFHLMHVGDEGSN